MRSDFFSAAPALRCWALGAAVFLAAVGQVRAHPHVFVEANVEFVRDDSGAVTELRHVWRFDELFSSTVLLDYDANGDGSLDQAELQEVSKTVTTSIAEYSYYTEMRVDGADLDFTAPKQIMVDFQDQQVLMFFALKPARPADPKGAQFKVAVADSSFYVALDIADEAAVQVKGGGTPCKASIERPDFDKLVQNNTQTLTEQFFANPKSTSELGDEWLTWITLKCE